ncbi:MAG TPA: CapA family protein [Candidatus Saccharimonadales bacterium]|nr:CapA family protein [Candidatus Saccharimonadales bacterium]
MKDADSKPTVNRRFYLLSGILIAIILLLSLAGYRYYTRQDYSVPPQKSTHAAIAKAQQNEFQNVAGTYLFSGTIMLGRAVETYANGNFTQPFSQLNTLGKYDARIGILECPVTDGYVSYQTQISRLKFNCKPDWLPELKKYYPIINVSSNHMYDMGATGFSETVSRLKGAGFQVVGNYNPHTEKDDCKPVLLPVNLQKSDGTQVAGSLPVAFCSYNYKELFAPAPGEIESIQKWSKIMPVVALMNGGPEYEHIAGTAQTNNAHKMIDEGADFVIGNGTHWVQNTEVYKGKLIVYSMGNFIFDQLDIDGRSALNVSVGMNIPFDSNVNNWLQVGSQCNANAAECLSLINAQNLVKIRPTFTFKPIGSYGGAGIVAHRADAQQQRYIEQRANWASTDAKLGE